VSRLRANPGGTLRMEFLGIPDMLPLCLAPAGRGGARGGTGELISSVPELSSWFWPSEGDAYLDPPDELARALQLRIEEVSKFGDHLVAASSVGEFGANDFGPGYFVELVRSGRLRGDLPALAFSIPRLEHVAQLLFAAMSADSSNAKWALALGRDRHAAIWSILNGASTAESMRSYIAGWLTGYFPEFRKEPLRQLPDPQEAMVGRSFRLGFADGYVKRSPLTSDGLSSVSQYLGCLLTDEIDRRDASASGMSLGIGSVLGIERDAHEPFRERLARFVGPESLIWRRYLGD
jgi:hypothetical protein